jgi:hypothetical protein
MWLVVIIPTTPGGVRGAPEPGRLEIRDMAIDKRGVMTGTVDAWIFSLTPGNLQDKASQIAEHHQRVGERNHFRGSNNSRLTNWRRREIIRAIDQGGAYQVTSER